MIKGIFRTLTSILSWNKTKETLSQQASKAAVNILKYQKQFGYFFANEALKLYDSIVVPILCYSADVWGYQYTVCIERVQSNVCKRVCCLNKHVPNVTALHECGRQPLSVIYMTRCVKWWCWYCHLPP